MTSTKNKVEQEFPFDIVFRKHVKGEDNIKSARINRLGDDTLIIVEVMDKDRNVIYENFHVLTGEAAENVVHFVTYEWLHRFSDFEGWPEAVKEDSYYEYYYKDGDHMVQGYLHQERTETVFDAILAIMKGKTRDFEDMKDF